MEKTLEQVRAFADKAHGTQTRKYSGERYIVHPVRVMETCAEFTTDQAVLAAALLHDVLEDTAVTGDVMREFLMQTMTRENATRTLALVVELTDVYVRKNYPGMNRRSRKAREAERLSGISADAQTIKYADIIDNSMNILSDDPDFAIVFVHEGKTLLQKMQKGNPILRSRAMKVVDDCLLHMNKKEAANEKGAADGALF
ncbi:MAG TPA: HD domain-containing protein [Ohtaekwangia sp.]|nr:HD domain-containing protein [Ohtaekwangia sp.]